MTALHKALLLVWGLMISCFLHAQDVVISEVLYNPSSGNERVKLTNTTGGTVNITNWWFCARTNYRQISGAGVSLVSGSLNMPAGSSVVLEFTSAYLNNSSSDLGLYVTGSFATCSNMVDFVQWGGSFDFPAGRENVAVEACLWEDEQFVATASPGDALFFDGSNTGGACNNCGNNGAVTMTLVSDMFNSQTTLPLELIFFEVRKLESANILEWSTAMEQNTLLFEIERSTDAKSFQVIGEVPALGQSPGVNHYEFTDSASPSDIVYYRLRYVDVDGTSGYSPMRFVQRGLKGSGVEIHTVRHNAEAGGIFTLLSNEIPGNEIELLLVNAAGMPVARQVFMPDIGPSEADIPTAGLSPGWYVLAIRASGKVIHHYPFVITR